jgi:hypothetical protein
MSPERFVKGESERTWNQWERAFLESFTPSSSVEPNPWRLSLLVWEGRQPLLRGRTRTLPAAEQCQSSRHDLLY